MTSQELTQAETTGLGKTLYLSQRLRWLALPGTGWSFSFPHTVLSIRDRGGTSQLSLQFAGLLHRHTAGKEALITL
ncbi:MAG: hypothetical protein ACREV2_09460 [Burkholderiales bacterium]